jgi:(1->4)-alpha-D-glucan 1-alpha-D-glucosylmutase
MKNLISTYRIQFHKDFTFSHFERLIPYLAKLGVRTVYASPIFESVSGSVHGYDVINPQRINPEIGTEAQLLTISQQLMEQGISWLQDIVPNHMAYDPVNPWIMDVLEKGELSLYGSFFDIDWKSPHHQGRLMAPFLGTALDDVLEKGELSVVRRDKRFLFAYYDATYPLHLRSYTTILQATNSQPNKAIQELLAQLSELNGINDTQAYALRCTEFQEEFAALAENHIVATYLDTCLTLVNASPDLMKQITDEQVYRLCFHGETDQRINYRRFFTVNSLICLNIQEPIVFDHVHRHTKNLLEAGVFQGLRVDHIDGLHDPTHYLESLRKLGGEETYIIVEKILEAGEDLPVNWPIQGATGYQFLSLVNNLFTRRDSQQVFTRFYQELLGEKQLIQREQHDKKALILYEHMQGELDNLFRLFQELNLADDEHLSALPVDTLKAAIGEFLIQCPVYRYYGNQLPLNPAEADAVRAIFDRIRKRKPDLTSAANLLEDVLLTKPQQGDSTYNDRALRFYQRCMQFTGPLMAKGVEDTLMYTYTRFIGHDEVGDSPEFFGLTTDDFHQQMIDRQARWPLALNATSTHDTKRGEDVRSRLNVLTDLADEWIAEVRGWRQLNSNLVQEDTPDANDEYFIYQTLIGAYPMPGQHEEEFPERLDEYLEKALREAKRHSTHDAPNEAYEAAAKSFARQLLDKKGSFWPHFAQFHRQVADYGIINSLSQVVLKCTCPGLPDVYQGCDGWDLSMVDPDNRRPVDFAVRQQWLDELVTANITDQWAELWQNRYDGRIKLWLLHLLLTERSQQADLFAAGEYSPLQVEGHYKEHVLAFTRRYGQIWYVVAIPLGIARLARDQQTDAISIDWEDTRLVLPAEAPAQWEHRLFQTSGTAETSIAVADLFTHLPLAVVVLKYNPNN